MAASDQGREIRRAAAPIEKPWGRSKHREADLRGLLSRGRRGSKIGLPKSISPQPSFQMLATFLPKCAGSRITDIGLIGTELFQKEAIDKNRYCFRMLNNKMCFKLLYRADHMVGAQTEPTFLSKKYYQREPFSLRLALYKVATPSHRTRQP